jgi:glycosyltransferase involved in cell wall biosynthesis
MNETERIYTGQDLAFIIPTKDRPEKVKTLLNGMAQQTIGCGRVIVVDGGRSVKDIVMSFSDRLPVEHCECHPPGQIRQKNKGISLLNRRTPLVGFLDDDIVLEPEALERMMTFWNECEADTAGVSFNIVNGPSYRYSWVKALMGMSSPKQGRVLRSGYNVATTPVDSHLKTQWLCGGATVWRKEILKRFTNREICSRWAICEDVIFSYPIGKEYPLYVCADAKVRHEPVYDHTAKMKYRYYGRTVTLWRLFFVESHVEFSRKFFLWMLLAQISARFMLGIFSFRMTHIEYAIGQIEGAIKGLSALHRNVNLLSLLNEDTNSDRR